MRGNGPRVRAGAGSPDPAGEKPKVEDTTWWGCAQSTASGAQEAPAGLGLGGLGQDVSEGCSQTLPRTTSVPLTNGSLVRPISLLVTLVAAHNHPSLAHLWVFAHAVPCAWNIFTPIFP